MGAGGVGTVGERRAPGGGATKGGVVPAAVAGPSVEGVVSQRMCVCVCDADCVLSTVDADSGTGSARHKREIGELHTTCTCISNVPL